MLNIFKKKSKIINLGAPVCGEAVPLNTVNDKVFSSGMMGQGMAFINSGDTIFSPCDGKITLIPESLHAIGITCDNGAEVLIHVGLDTVNLNGEGFTSLTNINTSIKKGMPLLKIDTQNSEVKKYDLTTMLIITNSADYQVNLLDVSKVDGDKTDVIEIQK